MVIHKELAELIDKYLASKLFTRRIINVDIKLVSHLGFFQYITILMPLLNILANIYKYDFVCIVCVVLVPFSF